MILRTLPDVAEYGQSPARTSSPSAPASTSSSLSGNAIIYAYTDKKYFYPGHPTPYLFVANYLSKGNYLLNGHHIDACDKYFYFLNPGDELEINFTGGTPLQTLLIMLTEQFVGSVLSASRSTDEELLSSPMLNDNHHHFPGVPFSNDGEVRFAISRMLHKDQDPGNLDIILSELLQAVYPLSAESARSLQKTGAKKTSTRQELYRRLFLAKEIMHDNVFENPTLDELAGEICLNKFHFLSRFRKVFGLTPHQYLNELKLQKATELLISSKYTVSDVCFMLGFASPATFSLLFKKRFKVSPSSLRKK